MTTLDPRFYPYRTLDRRPGYPYPFGNYCLHCGACDDEPAREKCTNADWHIPNANAPKDEVARWPG